MRGWISAAVLVAACKSNAPAPPPVPSASASASASASTAVVEGDAAANGDAEVASSDNDASADEGGVAMAAGSKDDGAKLPPLAKGAAWSVVRWDMTRADVESAFEKAGVKPEAKTDAKTGTERVTVKHGSWNGVVYFSGKKPTYIVVTGEHLSKDAAASVTAKIKERGGAPTQSQDRTEVRWKKSGGGVTTIVVANDGTVREEYIREGGSGDVGFAKLTWGMAPAAVASALTSAGYVARVTKNTGGLDPCTMPNAPPDCDKKKAPPETVTITKGDVEGRASFDAKGLTQIELSGPSSDKGAARLSELEKTLGKPTSREQSTRSYHADDVAKIELEVKERQPDGTFTVFETYRPKK